MTNRSSSIGIIGAGIAGLACAQALVKAGYTVTLFDKSRGVGGRMATRQTEIGGFDHGAQGFTVQTPELAACLRELGQTQVWPHDAQLHLGQPGINSIAQALAESLHGQLSLRLNHRVKRIESVGQRWSVKIDIASSDNDMELTDGLFDALVIAAPAEQTADLLIPVPWLEAKVRKVKSLPVWVLMLAFADALPVEAVANVMQGRGLQYPPHHRLGMIAHESGKPGRRAGERWVVHANPAWTAENLDEADDRVRDKLLLAFQEVMQTNQQPVHAVVHRWLYAYPGNPMVEPCLWDADYQVGACGDWLMAGDPDHARRPDRRIESAWQSGLALAREVIGRKA